MPDAAHHLSPEVFLRLIDLELTQPERARADEHLALCAACRQRRAAIEAKLIDLGDLYHAQAAHAIAGKTPTRDRLKAHLATPEKQPLAWRRFLPAGNLPRVAVACLLVVAISLSVRVIVSTSASPSRVEAEPGREPNHALTPGAVHPVTLTEICSATDDDLDPALPGPVQHAVLDEYGIHSENSAKSYQIDYLINPQLGGTNDIRNLWPQPYQEGTWSAREKDELEKHLHTLVCAQAVDLAMAQREIATDWIAAYRKYISQAAVGKT